ncbi:acid protease [Babesia ovata]|uniref:Acid protease n=1 Tax=Babesia ovata TaxID=189622 RepID=A0A2H6KI38_9APIC|nr:acid protease [Babesia ovata]GBE62662.1 acid protease [Babesia ovata]
MQLCWSGASSAFVTFEEYRAETYVDDEEPLLDSGTSIEIHTDNEFTPNGADREDDQLRKGPEMAFSREVNTNMWDWVTVEESNVDENDVSQQTQVMNASPVLPHTDGSGPIFSSVNATFTIREPLLAPDLSLQQSVVEYSVENKHLHVLGNTSPNNSSVADFWLPNVQDSHDNNAEIYAVGKDEGLIDNGVASLDAVVRSPLRDEKWNPSPRNMHSRIVWDGSIASLGNYADIATSNDSSMSHILNSPNRHLRRADDTAITGQSIITSSEEAHIPTAGLQCIPVSRDRSMLVLHRKELVSSSEESNVSQTNENATTYHSMSGGDGMLFERVAEKQAFHGITDVISDSRRNEV